MIAIERLSPLERAPFLLHDNFDTPLREVGAILEREPAAVRQLASRARRHVRDVQPRFASPESASDIVQAFHEAGTKGDIKTLSGILADEVAIHSDGGGKIIAFRNVVRGMDRVLRLFQGSARKTSIAAPTTSRPDRRSSRLRQHRSGRGRADCRDRCS